MGLQFFGITEHRSKDFDFSKPIVRIELAIMTRIQADSSSGTGGFFKEWKGFLASKDSLKPNDVLQGVIIVALFSLTLCTVAALEYIASTYWPVNNLQIVKGPTNFLDLLSYLSGLFMQRRR